MYSMIVEAHSGWRYIVLLVIVVAIVRMVYGWIRGSDWGVWDDRLGLAVPIILDIQLLLGAIVWIVGQHWQGYNALAAWEHPFSMLVVVAVAHITWSRVKKQVSAPEKFRTASIGFVIAAVILALGIARITGVV